MVYIEPKDIWEKFLENKSMLDGHTINCAEGNNVIIYMTCEDGNMVLVIEDYNTDKTEYEVVESEEEAVWCYENALGWILEDCDPAETEDEDDFLDPILASTYAFIGILTAEDPVDLNLSKVDLEDIAYQVAWYLRGRYDIDSQLA